MERELVMCARVVRVPESRCGLQAGGTWGCRLVAYGVAGWWHMGLQAGGTKGQ